VAIERLEDLTPDKHNANRGTKRGHDQLDHSIREYGAGRSILADKNGNVIAGNKTLQAAVDAGLKARVIETDGDELVVVVRRDLDLGDHRARELAYADNVIAANDLEWDADVIREDVESGVALDKFFFEDELAEILERADDGAAAEDASTEPTSPAEHVVSLKMTADQYAVWDSLVRAAMDLYGTSETVDTVIAGLRDACKKKSRKA
jgi:hypothetical protein